MLWEHFGFFKGVWKGTKSNNVVSVVTQKNQQYSPWTIKLID